MSIAETRVLRYRSRVTRKDQIRNEYTRIRDSIGVASIVDKMREKRLKWLGDVLEKEETDGVRIVKEMYVEDMKGNKRLDEIENDKKRADIKSLECKILG